MENYVGYCVVELIEEFSGVAFPMAIMYPTAEPGKLEKVGPDLLKVATEATPEKGVYPLLVISHGSGGSHLLYRTLAHHLAGNGFIVGMPEHPFNNRNNNTLAGTVENLTNRPRHLRCAINWFFDSSQFKAYLKPNSVSIIGHSLGGYTALAVAGGKPISFPKESKDGKAHPITVTHDDRVKALVLLAPAAVWFRTPGALRGVDIPILMLVGEKDEYTPYCYHAQVILDGVADKKKIRHRIVQNAGHFSFLSQFPPSMRHVDFLPAQDPAGFNRESFHQELNAEVLAFLKSEA